MISQEFKQKLYELKNKIGLVGGSIKINEYDDAEQNISAHISPDSWNIEVSVRKDFEPIKDKRQKAYARAKKITNGLETIISHVGILHESAHWELPVDSEKGCPYNIYWHDKILEAVKEALPKEKKRHAKYVTNAFEDVIINPRCKEFNGDFSGKVLFWDWQGIECKEKGMRNYTPFYEAFVKLNMHLFGENIDKALLKRHYSNNKKIDDAVQKVISDLNLKSNASDVSYLFNREKWPKMAGLFAKNLADLLDKTPQERLSAFSNDSQGEGEDLDKNQGEGEDEGKEEGSSGNGIEEKMRTEEGKEEVASKRHESGDSQSRNFSSYEQLDALYTRLARSIPVKVEAMQRESSLQIAPLTYRAFDEEKDSPAKIKASKLILSRDGLTFAYPNHPLTVDEKSKIQKRNFPDLKIILLDTSGSMEDAVDGSRNIGKTSFIPWGDNSKYHYALLGHYGIENFLQRQGIAQYIRHGISTYSTTSSYHEGSFFELEKIRKKALAPEFGGTNLDAKLLTDALKGRESFVLSISDGEIGNWNSEKETFKKLVTNNYFAHIQLGKKSAFTSDLESWGMPVFYVNSGQDLLRLMIDITVGTYKHFTKEK